MKLRLGKCWQYKNEAILWQVSPLGAARGDLPPKFFLKLSCQKEGAHYIRFMVEKSGLTWEASGAFASLVRKYIPSGVVEEILVDREQKNLWIPIISSSPFLLHIHQEGAVSISLENESRQSLVRMGVKGIFTKRKESQTLIPSQHETENLLLTLLKEMQAKYEGEAHGSPQKHPALLSSFQREARKRLARRLKTVRASLNNQKASFLSDDDFEQLETKARLLQTFAYKVAPQSSTLDLSKEETGDKDMSIPLDPKVSLGKNLDVYFSKIRKERRSRDLMGKQIARTEAELETLEEELARLATADLPENETIAILRRFRLAVDKPESPLQRGGESLPYRVYKSSEGVDILVGKGPRENDELTKSARSDDFWLHAIGTTGSHVIVRGKTLDKLSSQTKRDAAMLALHFSKLRKDEGGEVYVTQRRFLSKKKGMPPGLWAIRQSETYALRYTEEELREVLGNA
ncbi:MAG: DUF814 domain-containing protein [Deltaproteobacteria bacterium]|nr:DUF814 domain-containing protein [Deltaproteobacteria bacterium]